MVQTLQPPLAATAVAPSPRFSSSASQETSQITTLDRKLAEALATARLISRQQGLTCPASAVAWEVVEELMTAKFRQQASQKMTSLEQYCLEHPDAPESRTYDV